jgi:exopolysaccharide biosynthesis polyprenyl glycosylphosphotransferase
MLQRDRQIRTQVQQIADTCLFAASFWLAYALRSNHAFTHFLADYVGAYLPFFQLEPVQLSDFDELMKYYFALVPATPLVLESQGFYNRALVGSRAALFWPLLRSCFIVTLGLVLLLFLFRETAPRGVMVLFGLISFFLVWLKEEIILAALHSHVAKSQYRRRIILAGIPAETARMKREFAAQHGDEVEVVAEFSLASAPVRDIIELLHEHSVSGVLVSAKHAHFEQVENVIRLCEIEGVEAWLVADFFATQIARASFDEMLGRPLIVFRTTPEASWPMLFKLALDFFGSLALTIAVSPVMLAVALLVKFTSPGPVFFRQQRSGLNGAPFTIYKFRTMTSNAEQLKHELAAMNEMSGPVFKVTNDPRVTPVGKWLRKWSLDELPQLFNVLRGEMSLVGPRPLPVDEVKRFNDLAHRRRLSVKPGLTCLWQVKGRNKISDFKEWVRLDLEYIDNWSIWLDVKILLQTLPAVLRTTGAK